MSSIERDDEVCGTSVSIETCSVESFCQLCPRWKTMTQNAIAAGLLDDRFFNSHNIRFKRLSRGICLFMTSEFGVISKRHIMDAVWRNRTTSTSIPVLIYDLRMLLERQNVDITNIRGVGYALRIKKLNNQ